MAKAAGPRFHKHLTAWSILAASIAFSPSSILAQAADNCSVMGTPQVSPSLVKLESGLNRFVFRRGEPIHVALTLKGGVQGVYVPDYFGAFQHTCLYGFSTELLTPQGQHVNPNGLTCTGGGLGWHAAQYIELKPGETRTWDTDLPTAAVAPGHYCVYAEYLTQEFRLSPPPASPADDTRIAKGRISATPIAIEIR